MAARPGGEVIVARDDRDAEHASPGRHGVKAASRSPIRGPPVSEEIDGRSAGKLGKSQPADTGQGAGKNRPEYIVFTVQHATYMARRRFLLRANHFRDSRCP
jgi:hypothetical protein